MFDIDHFKDFNDLFGHDGGDALLRELGAFLNAHTRGVPGSDDVIREIDLLLIKIFIGTIFL